MSTNAIGLDEKKSKELTEVLNELLANTEVHYQNIRGLHWNIVGNDFFELHVKYEELYNTTMQDIDEIAERIVTLGQRPLHTFSSFVENSSIKELKDVTNGREGMQYLVDAYNTILKIERKALDLSDELNDEGTNALMSDLISVQEKNVWMFNAWLKKS